jgi:predicted amidohydrolase
MTYGRSMIVDPWGMILGQAPDEPTVVIAEIDLDRIGDVRRRIPSLANRRADVYGELQVEPRE